MLFKVDNKEFQINIRQAVAFTIPSQIPCNVDFIRKHVQTECTLQIRVIHQNQTIVTDCFPDRASVVSDIGKGVKSIAGRIEEYRRSQGDAGEQRKGRSQENSR